MAKNCLVYETLQPINEMKRTISEDGLMHLKGTFGVCGVKNNNQRIYEAGNYGKMVAEMKKRLEHSPILGELEHPSTMNITLENVSHKITDINIDENGVVSGEVVLLNTPKGKVAQAIVEGGAPLYISSRAQGMVDPRTSVVTLENLATYDLVGSPGFSQAELHLNEGQVAESICESCGVVYIGEGQDPNANETKENQDMEKEILEKITALESKVAALEADNANLKEQLENTDKFDKRSLCDGIQKWILEEFAPTIQKYIIEQYSPEVQKWVVESFAPEVQKWVVEQYSPEIQKWILEQYSPEVQRWTQTEFATGIQNWFVDECAPDFEKWVTENYGSRVANQITEAVEKSKKNSLSNIESTLSLLEGIQPTKPAYPGQTPKSQIVTEGAPKYISEMPADARVKYDLASQDIKEAIERRAKLFDFNKHSVNEFWAGVNFDTIKPVTTIVESATMITNERERAIRAQLSSWHSKRFG